MRQWRDGPQSDGPTAGVATGAPSHRTFTRTRDRKEGHMAIRQRGESWQIDIRTADGTRLRRDYRSKAEAQEAEAMLKPSPQQRAAMREVRRKLSARSGSKSASGKHSTNIVHISNPEPSALVTSRLSALIFPESARTPITKERSTPCSGGYSGPSGPGLPVSQGCPSSKVHARGK